MQRKGVELITNCLICREPSHQQPEPPLRTRQGGEADKLPPSARAQQGEGAIWDNLQEYGQKYVWHNHIQIVLKWQVQAALDILVLISGSERCPVVVLCLRNTVLAWCRQ